MDARRKKAEPVPINDFESPNHSGVFIDKTVLNDSINVKGLEQSERHDRHTFHLLETGAMTIEIDFQTYQLTAPTLIYMHPNQVHRLRTFDQVSVSSWAINDENLNPEYLNLLEEITPTQPWLLAQDAFSLLSETVALCLKFSERKAEPLYHSVLKDGCNALVAMVVSHYLEQAKTTTKLTRFELVTKAFKRALDRQFTTAKRPAEYAQLLAISTAYLNECVTHATGYSVSHHIQQRIVLEARRLLVHSHQSVKEIAARLGYDDYPYFSRLFTKVVGMSALAFRAKNRD
jgi:AraC family transcriptional regulator, transcriptional activator of pobA